MMSARTVMVESWLRGRFWFRATTAGKDASNVTFKERIHSGNLGPRGQENYDKAPSKVWWAWIPLPEEEDGGATFVRQFHWYSVPTSNKLPMSHGFHTTSCTSVIIVKSIMAKWAMWSFWKWKVRRTHSPKQYRASIWQTLMSYLGFRIRKSILSMHTLQE